MNDAQDRSNTLLARAWHQLLSAVRASARQTASSPPSEESARSADIATTEPSEVERLRQELQQCQAEHAKLHALYDETASRYAALNFKAYKLSEDNFTWEVNASGLRASEAHLYRERDQLRVEIDILRRVIASCDSQTDLCRQFREEIVRASQEKGEHAQETPREPETPTVESEGGPPVDEMATPGGTQGDMGRATPGVDEVIR
jgi:chromosome segregation ATPase